ncbi:MAG TPA: PLP-dependent aminotransferase family protein [Thermoleophilaceae bacterium]|nr:PLP-dependent aminotransferase family protein [Thermoleophilaceae bacterium]
MSGIDRDSETSLTQQLVDLFTGAIEAGSLGPGEKLPTTRALAAEAGVNHLTAARVYRRLAEMGFVTATVGRGTFVRQLMPAAGEQGDDWQVYALPDRPIAYAEQVLGDAFRFAGDPSVISLSTGHPAPETFPVDELARITADVFREAGSEAISYLVPEGLWELREQIAERGRARGFASDPQEIVVTSGARQALDLIAREVLEPGEVCVAETPSFIGMLSSLRSTGARVIGIPVDADGLDVDALEEVLARHEVRLVALQPRCHNPTGADLSAERRARLADLAVQRNFFILEDAVYADMRFEGEGLRPVRELAPSHTIYVNSLSKTVGGGLRAGWVAARGPILERLTALKMDTDFHTATLVQHIAARYLASGAYDRHVKASIPFYRERRDVLLEALDTHLAGEYRAERPSGGHHVWLTLTRPVNERELYTEALRHGVTFTPGGVISVERPAQSSLRLSFSMRSPDELVEGVKRLARALREVRRRDRHAATLPVS